MQKTAKTSCLDDLPEICCMSVLQLVRDVPIMSQWQIHIPIAIHTTLAIVVIANTASDVLDSPINHTVFLISNTAKRNTNK